MPSRTARFEVPWIWARVGLFIAIEGVLLVVYHFQPPAIRETIIFGATIVGAAFALYSYLRGIEDRRLQEAGRMIERWNAPDRSDIRKTMNDIAEGHIDPKTLGRIEKGRKILESEEVKRLHVIAALSFYEELAIRIFENNLDEERAYRFFKTVVDQAYETLMSWIENECGFRRCEWTVPTRCE